MRLKYIIILLISVLYIISNTACERKPCVYKNQICDSSLICLGNFTQDTIEYKWNTEKGQQGTLLPGERSCIYAGKIDVKYDKKTCEKKRKSFYTITVEAQGDTWAITVDHCNKVSNFRYDNGDPLTGAVRLYDETEP